MGLFRGNRVRDAVDGAKVLVKRLKQFLTISDPDEAVEEGLGDGGKVKVSEDGVSGLTGEQENVLSGIREYIGEFDEAPSQNKVIEYSPFGSSKTKRVLEELVEAGVVVRGSDVRYGNEASVYRPS